MSEIQIELDADNRSGIPKLRIDGHELVVRSLAFRTDAGHIPRLELELPVWDITGLNAANVEVLVDPTTSGYLERAGWTPPPGVRSVLERNEQGCPCERIEVWERPEGVMTTPDDPQGVKRSILGRSVPTCPIHGSR